MPGASPDAMWLPAKLRSLVLTLGAILAGSTVLVVAAPPASACSCAGPPIEVNEDFGMNGLADFDAAFIGTVVDSNDFGQERRWTFDIEAVLLRSGPATAGSQLRK